MVLLVVVATWVFFSGVVRQLQYHKMNFIVAIKNEMYTFFTESFDNVLACCYADPNCWTTFSLNMKPFLNHFHGFMVLCAAFFWVSNLLLLLLGSWYLLYYFDGGYCFEAIPIYWHLQKCHYFSTASSYWSCELWGVLSLKYGCCSMLKIIILMWKSGVRRPFQ